MREVCAKDIRSVEAEKMSAIQTRTGNQYPTNRRNLGTPHGNKLFLAQATLIVRICQMGETLADHGDVEVRRKH
jgi:hypothetical protein